MKFQVNDIVRVVDDKDLPEDGKHGTPIGYVGFIQAVRPEYKTVIYNVDGVLYNQEEIVKIGRVIKFKE